MPAPSFLPLPLAEWRETRDTLHAYTRLLSKIRRGLAPPRKHVWHGSLRVTDTGLTTTQMPIADAYETCEVALDIHRHAVIVRRGDHPRAIPLSGHSIYRLKEEVLEALNKRGVQPQIDHSQFADDTPLLYDGLAAERFLRVLQGVAGVFQDFERELPWETSPLNFWSGHFDLSLVWFSGRKVPDVDPEDAEYADEQMAFGFSTGDEGIPDPYIYITAYPWPDALPDAELPRPARWHLADWKGGLIFYNELAEREDARQRLWQVLRAAQAAGAGQMQR